MYLRKPVCLGMAQCRGIFSGRLWAALRGMESRQMVKPIHFPGGSAAHPRTLTSADHKWPGSQSKSSLASELQIFGLSRCSATRATEPRTASDLTKGTRF